MDDFLSELFKYRTESKQKIKENTESMKPWRDFSQDPNKDQKDKLIVQLVATLSTHPLFKNSTPEEIYTHQIESANLTISSDPPSNPNRAANVQIPSPGVREHEVTGTLLPPEDSKRINTGKITQEELVKAGVKMHDYHAEVPVSGKPEGIQELGSIEIQTPLEEAHEKTTQGPLTENELNIGLNQSTKNKIALPGDPDFRVPDERAKVGNSPEEDKK